jgi:acyl-CoA synthetase (AMP-forming)/AMP-acid ligase II
VSSALAHIDGPPLVNLDRLIWIGSLARHAAQVCPQRDAIIFPDRGVRVSYLELDRRSDAFVALMQARGLQAGDRVAYLGRNSDLFFAVLFGAIRAGLVLVPLNWRLVAAEIAYQLQDSATQLLICDPELLAVANAALKEFISPPPVLLTEGDGNGEYLRALLSFAVVSHAAPMAALPQVPDQCVLQLYTSGTTGRPKGVLISHYALSIARQCELISPGFALLTTGSISLSAMPNFHIGGMSWVLIGLVRFGTVVLTADPSPANMINLIDEYAVESSFIVPSALRMIIDEVKTRQLQAPRIKFISYGAMPIGEKLLRETMDLFDCSFGQFFGMTENTGSATYLSPADHDLQRPQLLASVGKPYPAMSVEIRAADGRVLEQNQRGEIYIKSPTLLLGYWQLPDKTREALVDGWYASGDGGYIDTDGYLYLTDRIKDMIVSGGENVYPVEVEEVLRSHPAVLEAACIGLPDVQWGEVVAAVIELRAGMSVTDEELRQFARTCIASFKCPKRILFSSGLPRTASGKVKRAELRAGLGVK